MDIECLTELCSALYKLSRVLKVIRRYKVVGRVFTDLESVKTKGKLRTIVKG